MTSKSTKVRVGLFMTITLVLLGIVLVIFGGMRFWEHHPQYRVVFDGSVYGLEKGAQVFLNGVRVGRVDEIAFDKDDLSKIDVVITVKDGTPIHTDTHAVMQFAGITGLKVIDLRDGTRGAPRLAEGAVIPQGETLIDKLTKQAEDIVEQSKQLMQRANKVVDNVAQITDPKQFASLGEIMEQTRQTATNLAATTGELHTMIGENRAALKSTIASINDTSKTANAMLENQVGGILVSAGDFVTELKNMVKNNEGQLRSAVFDLRQASRSFKELARDVRQRPSRLLFSSAPSERKLP